MKNEEFDINRKSYDDKVESIRKRKRNLKFIQDPEMVKRMKRDLKVEQRAAKRSSNNELKEWLKKEVQNYKN